MTRGSVDMWTRPHPEKWAAYRLKSHVRAPNYAATRANATLHRIQPPHLPLLGPEIVKETPVHPKTTRQWSSPASRLTGEFSDGR